MAKPFTSYEELYYINADYVQAQRYKSKVFEGLEFDVNDIF